MTFRQQLLKLFYPLLLKISRRQAVIKANEKSRKPPVSFYRLSAELNNNDMLDFARLSGKKVMIVNTASDCGYTPQYQELQQLYEEYHEDLVIIGFPANDFKEQEKGTDAEISGFCRLHFGVRFPLAKKSVVVKSSRQNKVFAWLTHEQYNGWNNEPPGWNFSKYLINEQGVLTHYFGPAVSPLSKAVKKALRP